MKKVKLFSLLAVSALAAAVAVPTFAASSDRLVVAQATNGSAALQGAGGAGPDRPGLPGFYDHEGRHGAGPERSPRRAEEHQL